MFHPWYYKLLSFRVNLCVQLCRTFLHDDMMNTVQCFLNIPYGKEVIDPLTPNDPYSGCTAPLTSKRCILYIYSTNIGTEYFKHGIYSLFYPLQNAVCFIILTYLVPLLVIFYIQGVLNFKKIILAPKG